MKLYAILILSCFSNLTAMELWDHDLIRSTRDSMPPQSSVYHVPAIANKVFKEVKAEQLTAIKSEDELSDTGIIEALVIRPKKDYRLLVASATLTPEYIEGDKNKELESEKEFGAVTIMRADVSEALGGFHIPGDNIHVRGLRLGQKYLQPGDLIVIKTPQQEITSVLIQTFIPHYACWKLQARCGARAFEFLHNKHNERLRGIRPVVLKGGRVSVGDQITIMRGNEKNALMVKCSLALATMLLQKSIPLAEKLEQEEAAKREYRQKAALLKQN